MAPAPLVMNPSGLRTCGGDRAEPGPLPFSVEALLEAQRALRRAPAEPREERPRRAAEPRACFPPSVRASSPRKCPVARFGARLAQIRRTRAPPAPRPAPCASTSTTASRGRPSPRSSCWRWSAGSARSSTCPSPSAPRSPAA
uniref:Uncharacterized protein n=1 Tax=Rousettus aegyptiacus TaxID=9407 RepID=A0A7J8GCS1_ROUAE|nr:hypothetical protein HJG63_013645 [Rousettus aegyptiacus]